MKYAALALAVVLLPAVAHAQIQSSTSATANTGGNTTEEGGSVHTGSASASASSHTTTAEGSSTVHIKTEANGQVHEETYTNTEGSVDVSVKATPTKTEVTVQKDGAEPTTYIQEASNLQDIDASVVAEAAVVVQTPEIYHSLPERIFATVSGWFGGLVSFFL